MYINTKKFAVTSTTKPISLRCPVCRHQSTLVEYKNVGDITTSSEQGPILLGQRRCPNSECCAHIFVIQRNDTVIATFPFDRVDFDSSNIPTRIAASLREAINCYAIDCFVAAAIMVRKTLEELCQDRSAEGRNLRERIRSLQAKVILPQELLDGLDDLRLLGNDAAHLESKEFEKIGVEEVGAAIEFTKEVLKAVFQYSTLLKRLQSLKKSKSIS